MKLSKLLELMHKFVIVLFDSFLVQASALCSMYGLIVTVYLILHIFVGERWLIVSAVNNILHLLTLFCVPAFVFTLIAKRYRFPWSLYLLPGTLAFFIWYGGELLPESVPNDPNSIEFNVMTYNIAKSFPVLSVVTDDVFGAEIIGLQEVPRSLTGFNSFAFQNGKGIYTHYPILSEAPEAVSYFAQGRDYTSAVKSEINIEGHTVSVYSLHAFRPTLILRPFVYETSIRTNDVRAVADAVANDPNPVIVFCDCNFSDRSSDYQLLASHLTDAWKQRGVGLGLTAVAPAGKGGFPFLLLRSDYIWHSDDFETVSIEVLNVELSDHYPVRARLRLLNTGE